jgi:hypothetical protein
LSITLTFGEWFARGTSLLEFNKMNKIMPISAVFGLFAFGSVAIAELPNERWSYDAPVVTEGDWELTGESRVQGQATFVEWERTTTTTQSALNPADRSVGTGRFDSVVETSETIERNQNSGPPRN